MSDEQHEHDEPPRWFTLEKKAMMADIRLMVIASVALNQFLSHVTLPDSVSTPAVVAAIIAPAAKSLLFRN